MGIVTLNAGAIYSGSIEESEPSILDIHKFIGVSETNISTKQQVIGINSTNWDTVKPRVTIFDEDIPPGDGNGCVFSYDSQYLAVTHEGYPYLTVYKRYSTIFVKLDAPDIAPPSAGRRCDFSQDGKYLAVVHDSAPYVTIYEFNNGQLTKAPNPDVLPTGSAYGCAFSRDNNYFAVAHNISPYITIYRRNDNEFIKVADPSVLPGGRGTDCCFHPLNTHLAVTSATSTQSVTVYNYSVDGAFTKISNMSASIDNASSPNGCDFMKSNPGGYLSNAIALAQSSFDSRVVYNGQLHKRWSYGSGSSSPSGSIRDVDYYNGTTTTGTPLCLVMATTSSPYGVIYNITYPADPSYWGPAALPGITGEGRGCAFSKDDSMIAIAHKNAPYISVFSVVGQTFTNVKNPTSLPTGIVYDCTFGSDDDIVVMSHATTPFVTMYKNSGYNATSLISGKIPLSKISILDDSILPTGAAYSCGISPDNKYIAIGCINTAQDRLIIYKSSENGITKVDTINNDDMPSGTVYSCKFSNDNNYLAVTNIGTTTDAPFLRIFKRSEDSDTFTRLNTIDVLPDGITHDCAFSSDSNYLAIVCSNTAPVAAKSLIIYKRNNDNFIKLADPNILPEGVGRGCIFTPDNEYLIIAHTLAPYISLYKRTDDTFKAIAAPSVLPTSAANGCAISSSGKYVALALQSSPYIVLYENNNGILTKLANPTQLPPGTAHRCTFSHDENYLIVTSNGSPYASIYHIVRENVILPATLQYINNLFTSSTYKPIISGIGKVKNSINADNNVEINLLDMTSIK